MTTTAPARLRVGLALSVALGGLTIVLDTTIAVVAAPALVRVFGVPLATVTWVTTAYVLALAATMPAAAWLGERWGARRVYALALLVFAAASAWAGAAHAVGELIAARALQGLGGGLITPVGMTIALRGVPAASRGRTAALLGLPVLVGPLVGPLLAGWLIDTVSWRAIFYVTVPPALAAAALVARLAPPDRRDGRPPAPDVVGLLLLVPGSVAVVAALAQADAPAAARGGLLAGGALLIALFARHARRAEAPLLDLRLLRDPVFAAALAVLALFAAAYFGSMLLTPTYVQITRGASAVTAGSLGIPAGLATGLSLQLATRLVDRLPGGRIVATGLAVAALSCATGIAVLRADTPFWVLAVLGAALGAGAGAVLMPATAVATRALDGAALASGSTILVLAQQLANATGTAGITGVFSALVTWRLPGSGGLEAISRSAPEARAAVAAELTDAQRLTQGVTLALILLALAVAVRWLPARSSGSR